MILTKFAAAMIAKKNNNLQVSRDGSHTLMSKHFGETYHSSFGAVQESNHIFMDAALGFVKGGLKQIAVFEVGFGTGLNALLTYAYARDNQMEINYIAVEKYPVEMSVVEQLNYPDLLNLEKDLFLKMHSAIGKELLLSPFFKLTVIEAALQDYHMPDDFFNVVFFDAFSPESQPEMWKQSCFEKIYQSMRVGGVLTTYSSKGIVKRALKAAGFSIEKLPGPPGKREFVRAVKGGKRES